MFISLEPPMVELLESKKIIRWCHYLSMITQRNFFSCIYTYRIQAWEEEKQKDNNPELSNIKKE